MQVDFYHLTRSPLDRVLPRFAEGQVARGHRLLVVSEDAEQRRALDRAMWTFRPDSFLPHAELGVGDDALQAVLIADDVRPVDGVGYAVLVDGRWRDAALTFERAFHFFADDDIAAARGAWKALAGRDGVEPRYWRQGENGWEQAA